MKDALAIQDRFASEPVFAKTGKGYAKSVGTMGNALTPPSRQKKIPSSHLLPDTMIASPVTLSAVDTVNSVHVVNS